MTDQDQKPNRKISEETRAKNRERARKWRADHPGAMASYMRGYRSDPENRERMDAANRRYRAEHREECNLRRKKWGEDHPAREQEAQRRWYHERGGKQHLRRRRYLKQYGVSVEWYDETLKMQGGGCAICGGTEPGGGRGHFQIDHDHSTGAVRGLLCHGCNTGIGSLQDNPAILAKATVYLNRYLDQDSLTSAAL